MLPTNKKLLRSLKRNGEFAYHALDQRLKNVGLRENGFDRIARDKKMNESSIRTIWKNKEQK
jgi:hypothetical protein